MGPRGTYSRHTIALTWKVLLGGEEKGREGKQKEGKEKREERKRRGALYLVAREEGKGGGFS